MSAQFLVVFFKTAEVFMTQNILNGHNNTAKNT